MFLQVVTLLPLSAEKKKYNFLNYPTKMLSSVQRCITVVVGGASSPCSINNGGCSDECITISSASYYCDCPRKCWYLATDGRTCKPNFEIDCGNQRMDIVVPTCAVDSSILSVGYHASLVNPTPEECKVQIDEDFYNFSISYSQCQMHVWETFWEITYSNTVRLWAESLSENSNSTNNVITRGAWYLVPVSCTFFKFGNVTTFFKPEDQQVALLSVPGMGAFSFSLDFYNSSTFNEAVGPYDYPLTFTVNSDIYFGVRAVGGGANMQIFTINCVALPNTNDDSLLYTMISDGCLLDATMVQYPSSSSMENHFSIKAFKFRESLPSPDGPTIVHISCSVMVCTDNLQITRCSQGCVNTDISVRKKRSSNNKFYRFKRQVVDDDDDDDDQSVDLNVTESPIQQVASRDINIVLDINVNTVAPEEKTTNGNPTPTIILVAAGVVGVACFFLVVMCFIICYHNKYIRPRNEVLPLEQHNEATYVHDVFLPSIDLAFNQVNSMHSHIPVESTVNEFMWSRRIINGHNAAIFAQFPTYKSQL
ncbi:unnamed protein product [Clavelina lepadiformis]|uniref:ZP domain-containing protein n=1 Tax=Clavelina lepadiformis TaxID=159417 RepID=A0ABP0GJI6_CLALP